jgi:ubiquitin carboxyl-terminal hydrolase 4/11/15
MGGAADLPHRSSSPLKRRAEELDAEAEAEAEAQSSQKDDVDMIVVPESDPLETIDASTRPTHPGRTQSIDMLREEPDASASDSTAQAESTVTAVTPNSGLLHIFKSPKSYMH